jgi:hypothetical protein
MIVKVLLPWLWIPPDQRADDVYETERMDPEREAHPKCADRDMSDRRPDGA